VSWNRIGLLIPVVIGVVAGALNFMAVRSAVTPIALVAAGRDLKAGSELTEDALTRVNLRADRTVVRSAVRWEERGILVGRRVNRAVNKDELIFFADARQAGGEAALNLRAGEASITVAVPPARVVPGVRVGDDVMVLLVREGVGLPAPPTEPRPGAESRLIGPFRVVGFGERSDPFQGGIPSREEMRQVVVAVRIDAAGVIQEPAGKELEEALRKARGERVSAIEFPGPR
jgi:hypothetical protein